MIMKKILFTFVFLLASIAAKAYDAKIDGIYYDLVPKAKVAIVTEGDTKYEGDIIIPSTFEYEGVVIGLGVKTGNELYFAHIDVNSEDKAMQDGLASVGITENFDLIGASLVTLTGEDGSFDLEHLYFNERENGDFSVWVKW